MKKSVAFVSSLFLILMFITFTSAVCSTGQTILKLYSANNTHGALWNDSIYTQDVCYNDIFGVSYSASNPNICMSDGSNLVLKLSSITNAHAEIPNSTTFSNSVSICYGNLACGNYSICPPRTMEVVRLSSATNAHIAVAGQNPGNAYNTLICCGSGGTANWKDMLGKIIDLNNVSVNNTVILSARGIQPGTSLNFQIYERNAGAVSGRTFTNISDSNGRASVMWKITDSDMGGRARSEFYFNVTNTSLGVSVTSPSLYANTSNFNVAPRCAILSPIFGSVHSAGENVVLRTNLNAEDPDSVVTISWKIINESTNIQEVNLNNETVNYVAVGGTKTIILNVTDDAGKSCYNSTAISVFTPVATGQNPRTEVFAWITNPLENQVIQSSEYRVDYSASASYAYNVTPGNCGDLVCVAGTCPSVDIECGSERITLPAGASLGYSSLNFSWTFDTVFGLTASGLGKFNGSRTYLESGDKTIKVVANYGSASDAKTRKFNLMDGCERVGNNAYRVNMNSNGQLERINTRNVADACEGPSTGSEDDCCPNGGWICTSDYPGSNNQKLCQQPVISAATCSDYLDSTSCAADIQHVGNNASYFNNAQDIYNFYNCSKPFNSNGHNYLVICGKVGNGQGCVWYDNSCKLNVSLQDQVELTPLLPGCLYESKLGECVGGYQNVTISGISVGGADVLNCASLNREEVVLCGRTGVRLPFFGVLQFVVAILIIILIYYLIRKSFFRKIKGKKK